MRRALAALVLLVPLAATASTDLARLGEGTLRWFGFKVYEATLWAAGQRADLSAPLRLELRYARALSGRAIAERSDEEIARLGFGTAEARARWLDEMRRLFPDVEAGDALAGEHLPGQGARFFRNGAPLGEIADPEFSRAFFSIWLDPRTSAPALRAALLGRP
ncbi:MAG: chalcone isomerase family protein [Burkholderiales bacterium]